MWGVECRRLCEFGSNKVCAAMAVAKAVVVAHWKREKHFSNYEEKIRQAMRCDTNQKLKQNEENRICYHGYLQHLFNHPLFFLSNGDGGGCVMVVWHVCTV